MHQGLKPAHHEGILYQIKGTVKSASVDLNLMTVMRRQC